MKQETLSCEIQESPSFRAGRRSIAINQNIDPLRDLYQLHNAPYNQSRSRFVDPIPGETGHEYRMRVEMIVRNLVINSQISNWRTRHEP